jgi:peroxiredoxin Q/BCP
VVGISPDTVEKHCAFRDKYDLGVTLAADPELAALNAYGVWGEKKTFGHTHVGVHRTSFLIAPEGTIAAVFPVRRIRGHAEAVLDAARKLVSESR